MRGFVRLDVHPERIDPRKLRRAADIVAKGGVVAYPTDTVYALGCSAGSKKAIEQIRRAKGMSDDQRLALLFADVATAATIGHFSQAAYRLARRVLPGPYTFVLPALQSAPRAVVGKKRRHIGVRVPASDIARTLAELLGEPLVTTSAIPRGDDRACADIDEILDEFESVVDVVIDGGETPGQVSTVIAFDDDGQVDVLREGLGPIDFV